MSRRFIRSIIAVLVSLCLATAGIPTMAFGEEQTPPIEDMQSEMPTTEPAADADNAAAPEPEDDAAEETACPQETPAPTPPTGETAPAEPEDAPDAPEDPVIPCETDDAEDSVIVRKTRFELTPGDAKLRVLSVRPSQEDYTAADAEIAPILDSMPPEAVCYTDEAGNAVFDIVTYRPEADDPQSYALEEGRYFLYAACKGYLPSGYVPFAVSYEGANEMTVRVTLTPAPAEPAEAEPTEEPLVLAIAVTFDGLPEGGTLAVVSAAGEVMAQDATGVYPLVPGNYLLGATCPGYQPLCNVPFTVDETTGVIAVTMIPEATLTPVTFALAEGMTLIRVEMETPDEAGESVWTECLPDETGAYALAAGNYRYIYAMAEETRTGTFTVDGTGEALAITPAWQADKNTVTFVFMQEGVTFALYRLGEDGAREDILPEEDGAYLLTAGQYFYDATCDGCASALGVPLTVTDASEVRNVYVWLLSDERAGTAVSPKTVLFAVRGTANAQAAISSELQALLDELGVVRSDYFFTEKREGGWRSIYSGVMDGGNVWYAVDRLLLSEEIDYAEPDYLFYTAESGEPEREEPEEGGLTNPWVRDQSFLTNAPYYATLAATALWGSLEESGHRPGEGMVVAVIDTGVDYTHQDLASNMWVNRAEKNGTAGVDDDGNGYVDDVYGYNFVWDNGNPKDDNGHGTHVAGIIAMADNGIGGVGLAYGAKIMAIKAGQATGTFSASDIARAVLYAKANGADVINMSFGGYSSSSIVESALKQAFSDCVLVAAAGNDSKWTTDLPMGADMFPAAYTYVLGVMATDAGETSLAGFSNFDPVSGTKQEYEVAAPGVSIYSTLPGNRYAKWSGTSMAAPLVSAAAAVLRSAKGGSTRYIMGQIAGATEKRAGSYPALDPVSMMNLQPKPELTVSGVALFDAAEFSDANNGDGVWQNGETINLGLVIRNRWGAANRVTVTADSLSETGTESGLVEWIDTASAIDTVGTYAEANTGYIYTNDALTGVSDPITFKIREDAPNALQIPINLHVRAMNALDEADQTVYTAEYQYILTVENGRVISGILTEDTTLTSGYRWIIRGSLQVPEGITLTVEPGAHIYFERAYTGDADFDQYYYPYMEIIGTANFNGTAEAPISIDTDSMVLIFGAGGSGGQHYYFQNRPIGLAARCSMSYVTVDGGSERAAVLSDEYLAFNLDGPAVLVGRMDHCRITNADVAVCNATASQFNRCALTWNVSTPNSQTTTWKECEIVGGGIKEGYGTQDISDCVLTGLKGTMNAGRKIVFREYSNAVFTSSHCAFLLPLNRPKEWIRPQTTTYDYNMANWYWGTDNASVIQDIIIDSNDTVSLGTLTYAPHLTKSSDMSSIYPFVVDAWVEDMEGSRIDTVLGAQTVTFHVLFNRDMNQSVQPDVAFGPDAPYNDNRLSGDWFSAREWTARADINPVIEYGTMYISVSGAAAARDSWLTTATDTRCWFNIASAGAEAMVLQSSAGQDGIRLSWTQDDFDTLAGYNLYRSQSLTEEGGLESPVRVNDTLLPYEEMSFVDANVTEGETYYYMFTVMQTDFTESSGSNISSCVALDMTKPVITHTPVDAVTAGGSVNVSANVTDNVGVVSVTLYARAAGAAQWQSVDMTNVSGSLWYATVAAGQSGDIEYYISAFDGTGNATHASPEEPHVVRVLAENIVKGDANLDGDVDVVDLTLTAQAIAGLRTLGGSAFTAADINGDSSVDIFDLMRIAQFICGIIDNL